MTATGLLIPMLAAAVAAGFDLVRFRIPNALCLGLALLFFPAAWLMGLEAGQIFSHVQAGGLMLVLGFLLFLTRAWGGGDAKLFAALSLWLGWSHLAPFAFVMALAGGILALMLLLARRRVWPENLRRHPALRRLLTAKSAVPYGVAMAVGMVWLVLRP